MKTSLSRRDFLKAAPVAAFALTQAPRALAASSPEGASIKIQPFDYRGVRLLPSQWRDQYQAARDVYLKIPDDDTLHGFRAAAGLPAPGKALGGWCRVNSGTVFGQWLSGMARMYRATNDTAIRDKAAGLFNEWVKTIKPNGDTGMRHYAFEKVVCGLVDLKMYADFDDAIPVLERITKYAAENFNHDNVPAENKEGSFSGKPGEWYTMSENPYRAYLLTGNKMFKDFGAMWHYNAYWDKFVNGANPDGVTRIHAYSHVNTFSSAAMAYWVTGDKKYLKVVQNAYNWLQNTQCYATGGYGPSEEIAGPTELIGDSIAMDNRQMTGRDAFETACGSWAAFKLSRYLMQFTGDAHYGDWTERIFYNGIGSALPMTVDGKNFYYSDYRLNGGTKIYYQATWACCAGSYIQAVADYHNVIYYQDPNTLYVNLYVPSEVNWAHSSGNVKVTQETQYPVAETSTLKFEPSKSGSFTVKFRIPAWTKNASIHVNGSDARVRCTPGEWASLKRTWKSGDTVEINIPQTLRLQAVDTAHPRRMAVVRGPVVLVLENEAKETAFRTGITDAQLNQLATAGDKPGYFNFKGAGGATLTSKLRPFYTVPEKYPYRIYFDV